MTLPVAVPGYGGTIMPVSLVRCWANIPAMWGSGLTHCPNAVSEDDDLGLCSSCLKALLP